MCRSRTITATTPTACLSVTYYESISGEELSPYRRLTAGCVKTFLGGMEPYRVLIHKNIPITSIGIDITPAYYETWLKRQYPEEYVHPLEAFVQHCYLKIPSLLLLSPRLVLTMLLL